MSGKSIVVIGGGISGLATAALLARDGHEVTLLEARDEVGGRAGTWREGDFTFDTGPSWYLMPEVFDHFFRMMGTSSAEELDLARLDPGYRVYFENDPAPFDLPAQNARDAIIGLDPAAGEPRSTASPTARPCAASRGSRACSRSRSTASSPRTRRPGGCSRCWGISRSSSAPRPPMRPACTTS
jgi:choline dehydrogenase-like flavoprotein